jgi:hypothetical protein
MWSIYSGEMWSVYPAFVAMGDNLIRVFWSGFDSEWNQSNLKTMKKRFYKNFIDAK